MGAPAKESKALFDMLLFFVALMGLVMGVHFWTRCHEGVKKPCGSTCARVVQG